ncbi:MAG: hypothetical protein KAH33_04135, partial [Candidatus Delongbacteria bacterium]|nr:hypothetical protein [Candidatus Delongbacteria bacterium]
VDIEFEVKTPVMLEYNSVTPDVNPVGYFTDLEDTYFGSYATFDSLGHNTYRYKTNMDDFIAANDTITQKLRTYLKREPWLYGHYSDSPCDEIYFKIIPKPIFESPTPNKIIHVTGSKGVITDTLAIKVSVPEMAGSYSEIDIKIDDVYVPHGDIIFDTADSLWVYNWDLSGVSSGITGQNHTILAEIAGNPISSDITNVYVVEAVYYEDFEAFTGVGWDAYSYESPELIYNGWFLNYDPLDSENICMETLTQNSNTLQYILRSSTFVVPASSSSKTILDYRIYFDKESSIHSNLSFWIQDGDNNYLTARQTLYPVDGVWTDFNYDLSEFAGQTIRFRWENYYQGYEVPCESTTYALDDIVVYVIPDMDSPNIDFVYGNHADLDADMILNLEFNDLSGIDNVTADYEIESYSDTITLMPVKGTYNYVGTIPARDHECAGDIVFKIKDSVGNETVSSDYSISWSNSTQILTAPDNLLITTENESTVTLEWDVVAGATEYKVYTSEDPYGTFSLDTLGTFTSSTQWQKNITTNKIFYYIIAANSSKMMINEKEIEYMEFKDLIKK